MKWEYMSLTVPASGFFLGGKIDAQELVESLNRLGCQRWELVSVCNTSMLEGKTRDLLVS